jgi:protein O-mannosyl-transferase
MTKRTQDLLVVLLIVMTVITLGRVLTNGFVDFDDREYVTENPVVRNGFTLDGVQKAFGIIYGNWHPVTWFTHMFDCQVWGLNPSGHHLTSLILHVANAVLLLFFLHRVTGSFLKSWFVAALFAVHPLHVESVAWLSERKDLVSAFFCMLTLHAYAAYVDRPRPARYVLVLLLFALGLMGKQALVTLPFALLLLDVWPLRRAGPAAQEGAPRTRSWGVLIVEKIPLLVLSAASSVTIFVAQRGLGAVTTFEQRPFWVRAGNAVLAYVQYLRKAAWPTDLTVFYPMARSVPGWSVAWSAALLVAVSVWAIAQWRRRPYLPVGWLWFLGVLVPMIGLVQIGSQAMADRYTYLSLIGIFIMAVWGVSDLAGIAERRWGGFSRVALYPAGAVLAVLMAVSCVQAGYWHDSAALFGRALAVGGDSWLINYNMGVALAKQGRLDEAVAQYNLALRAKPDHMEAHNNLGEILSGQGRADEAEEHLREAVRLQPDFAPAHNNLGIVLATGGHASEAIEHFREAARLDPGSLEYEYNVAQSLVGGGRYAEAVEQYHRVLALQPGWLPAMRSLAWLMATAKDASPQDREEAVRLGEDLSGRDPGGDPFLLDVLATAYAAAGRFEDACDTARKALSLLDRSAHPERAARMENRLGLFEKHRPYVAQAGELVP